MKASERIINAIIFGNPEGTLLLKERHPLQKSPCPRCGSWICEKDMRAHLAEEHEIQSPEFQPMFGGDEPEEQEQSRSEENPNAHQ